MLFNIERDEGCRIVGYIVPDTFSGSPSVRVSDGETDIAVLRCNEERAALVAAGRHETGRCGFTIDDTIVADLVSQQTIELYDSASNTLIYRRRAPASVVQKRLLRLETHLIPLWRLDDTIDPHFQFFHKGIERHGAETTTQVFLLNNATSLYLSGRLLIKAFENYIDETFNCVALLRNPYQELAERLMTLNLIHKLSDKFHLLGERDMMMLAPAIGFAQSLQIDEKTLHRAFATMPKAAIPCLSNPLTRQLVARTPDEVPIKGGIAAALGALAGFSIVGLREYQQLFLAQLANLLGVDEKTLPSTPEITRTGELAGLLRQVPEAGLLIEQDLEVYHAVKSAIEAVLHE